MSKLKVGDPAPDFSLPDASGKLVKLTDFRGKKVILYFYPKDFTSGCTTQACNFRDHDTEIREKNGIVLGVSPDSAQSHQKFLNKYNLPFILLSDPDHKVIQMYGAWGEKINYGRKYMGVIRSHYVIDEQGKIRDVQLKVKAADSTKLAMEALG